MAQLVRPDSFFLLESIHNDGIHVDSSATVSLRKKMKSERLTLGLFSFGPDIETLRANCEEETGLPAPRKPQWLRVAAK